MGLELGVSEFFITSPALQPLGHTASTEKETALEDSNRIHVSVTVNSGSSKKLPKFKAELFYSNFNKITKTRAVCDEVFAKYFTPFIGRS